MDNNFFSTQKLFGKRALIVGSGISGKGAASALKQCGAIIDFYEGELSGPIDFIIISPGIKDDKFARFAKEKNIPIMGEIELGFLLDGAPAVAVTGTNGKTTTTMLIGEMLNKSGFSTVTCGNIGVSYALSALAPHERSVVEVSSFQLLSVDKFKPKVAVITNITPDHLDRHESMEGYIDAKLNICRRQDENDFIIVPPELVPRVKQVASSKLITTGSEMGIEDGALTVFGNKLISVKELFNSAEPFILDSLFASAAAMLVGANACAIRETLKTFVLADHRLCFEGTYNGKNFYNDSKGTNIGAAIAAAKSMHGSTALIAGGSDKGYEFDELFTALPKDIKYVIGMGNVREKLKQAAARQGFNGFLLASGLEDAVHLAKTLDVINVLLSPAAASFDCYAGYDKRGEHFKRLISE